MKFVKIRANDSKMAICGQSHGGARFSGIPNEGTTAEREFIISKNCAALQRMM